MNEDGTRYKAFFYNQNTLVGKFSTDEKVVLQLSGCDTERIFLCPTFEKYQKTLITMDNII